MGNELKEVINRMGRGWTLLKLDNVLLVVKELEGGEGVSSGRLRKSLTSLLGAHLLGNT